jgi:ABC-type transporter Mla subunit MlaD
MRRLMFTLAVSCAVAVATVLSTTMPALAATTTSPYVVVLNHGVGNVT